jgi:hypothetical protein
MSSAAVVARSKPDGLEYLVSRGGQFDWAGAERDANVFCDIREATRAALALPSKFRAFALPIRTDAE